MNAHVNWFRGHEGFRFRPQCYGRNYATLMDYEKNSLFGYGYNNYGYQPYQPQHNNFFGKLLGFGAVAALGYGIGQSGGIIPFFNKIGGFLNKLFGKKETHREERREDLGDIKRREPLSAKVESRQQQPGLIGMDKLQAQSNKSEEERKAQREKDTKEEKKADANTLLPTDKGYQLPEVVITAKKLHKVESLPARVESNLPTGLNALKLPTQQPIVQQTVAQEPVVKQQEEEKKPNTQINPHDTKISVQNAINGVSEKDNNLLTAEQLSKMTPEQQEEYKKNIKDAILK